MRHPLLALLLASALLPLSARADSGAACNVMDAEALTALQLGNATKKPDHKDVPATKNAPKQRVDTCVMAPKDAPLPSLSVTSVALPAGTDPVKLTCSDQVLPTVKLAICNATAKGRMLSFALVLPTSAETGALRSQVERLVQRIEAGKR